MPTKKKAASKKKTASKAANTKRLKAGIARAKAIRKKSPGKKWQTCVKEAFKK